MASAILPQTIPYQPVRLSVHRYHQLTAAGAFDENDAVELLDGVVVEKMPKNPPHRLATRTCDLLLSQITPTGWHVQNQEPITLQNSEPEPDIAIIRGHLEDYSQRHPSGSEVELVIEVADTSLVTDCYKAELYAQARIPTYWLINLNDRCIEVMDQPETRNDLSVYNMHRTLRPGQFVDVVLAQQVIGQLDVAVFFADNS